MEIQIGDRFTDQEFEWEVLTRPAALHGGKSLRARIRRPGLPETEREMTWQAPRARGDPAGFMMEPFLLPWVRVLLLIRSITSTTWGHAAWPL